MDYKKKSIKKMNLTILMKRLIQGWASSWYVDSVDKQEKKYKTKVSFKISKKSK